MAAAKPQLVIVSRDPRVLAAADALREHVAVTAFGHWPTPPSLPPVVDVCWLDHAVAAAGPAPNAIRFVHLVDNKAPLPPGFPVGLTVEKAALAQALPKLTAQLLQPAPRPAHAGLDLALIIQEFHEVRLPVLCHRCTQRLPELLGYTSASLYLYDETQGVLTLTQTNQQHPLAISVEQDATGESLMAAVAHESRPLITDDVSAACAERRIPRPERIVKYRDQSCLIAPLRVEGRLVGVLNLNGRRAGADPETAPLGTIFGFIARALDHARHFEKLQTEALVDAMTGLANYRSGRDALAREIRRSQRFDAPLSLILIDIDGLKQVNDLLGHAAGDALIRAAAQRIQGELRRFDTAVRTGGDEFFIVLPSTAASGAQQVAQRILEAFAATPLHYRDVAITLSGSLGLAQWQNGWTIQDLLDAADRAMYAAKRGHESPEILAASDRPLEELVASRISRHP